MVLKAFVFIILLNFINLALSDECVINNQTPDSVWEKKLKNDLACNYNREEPPANNTIGVEVTVKIILKYFKFDENEQIFSIYTWLFLGWYDDRLIWKPEDYNGIDKIESDDVWLPGLKLINAAEPTMDYLYISVCDVEHDGFTIYAPRKTYETQCNTNLRNWPYDMQSCVFKFGGRQAPFTKVNFSLDSSHPVNMIGAQFGTGWNIIGLNHGVENDSEVQFYITFLVERQAEGIAAVVVIPTIVISVLTISSFLLDVNDNIRLSIVCFSLLSHFLFLQELNNDIPKHSHDSPVILIFLRCSILLTAFVVILTYLLSLFRVKETPAAAWISSLNYYIFQSYGRFIIVPRWKVDVKDVTLSEEINSNRKELEEWTDFANILNSMCLFIVVIVYVVLFTAYIPHPTSSSF